MEYAKYKIIKPTREQLDEAFSILELRQASKRRRGLDGSMMSRLDWRMRENRLRKARG